MDLTQNAVLGLLVRGLVFGEGTINDYAEFEQTNEETGWGYKKIVGYGEKMGVMTVVKKKIELMATEITTAQPNTYFKTLWEIHPVQQRRKAGCFADIDIPVLQAVKIKSAVPFSLGLGCSRSPLQKL